MPLEYLQPNVRPNVKQVSHELVKTEKDNARRLWENLKRSNFFDEKNHQFVHGLKEDNGIESEDSTFSSDKVYEIWVQSLFNSDIAKEKLKRLEASPLFNNENGMLDHSYYKGQSKDGYSFWTADQLLGILVLTGLNRKEGRKRYTQLKNSTYLFDLDRNMWNFCLTDKQYDSRKDTQPQLIGILVENLFDPEAAKEQLKKLKKYRCYDRLEDSWKGNLQKDHNNQSLFTNDQLLGIIIDIMVEKDYKKARKKLEALKNGPLYNKKNGRWISSINWKYPSPDLEDQRCYTSTMMLEIIINKLLEKDTISEELTDRIPQTKEF